ncbi:MAG: hypothetical protein LPJ89_09800, partial [Hymenobacteraceae bacterium]|nr:hypothetical protein [Hymenobacteraceae bacterium]
MKRLFYSILFLLSGFLCSAQQSNHWNFGLYSSLDFSSGTRQLGLNSAMYAPEGTASISDNSGTLQFYTNGVDVWNRNNNVMPNGINLQGKLDVAQGVIALPAPGNNSRYYIFTVDPTIRALVTGLKYSIVEMSLNGGLGDVTTKNAHIYEGTTEHLTAIKHYNKADIWVMMMEQSFQKLRAYRLTSSGVSATPVFSSVGVPVTSNTAIKGCMKFSQDGRKLAVAVGTHGFILYDFNNSTGVASNPMLIPAPNATRPVYGLEFSPNGEFLYVSDTEKLYQYNITSGVAATIAASLYVIDTGTPHSIQLGPDDKIYVAYNNDIYLRVINWPNNARSGCNFAWFILPQFASSLKGLPQYLTDYKYKPLPAFTF